MTEQNTTAVTAAGEQTGRLDLDAIEDVVAEHLACYDTVMHVRAEAQEIAALVMRLFDAEVRRLQGVEKAVRELCDKAEASNGLRSEQAQREWRRTRMFSADTIRTALTVGGSDA